MFLPIGTTRATNHLVVKMAFPHSTILASSSGHAPQLTVLVHGITDPVDARITADSLMERIDQYYFKVFIDRVLTNPVGVEYSETTKISPSTFLLGEQRIQLL